MSTDASSSSPPPKRQRIATTASANNRSAASTLSKPFKSPVKSDSTAPAKPILSVTPTAAPAAHQPDQSSTVKIPAGAPSPQKASLPSPVRTTASRATPTTSAADVIAMRNLRADIDTLTQATRLLKSRSVPSSSTQTAETGNYADPAAAGPKSSRDDDEHLRALIAKWRKVSQAAAEEVHAFTLEKVNRMGGVAGLRDRERRAQERRAEWEREDRLATEGDSESAESGDGDSEEDADEEVKEARRAAREVARERRRERMQEAKDEAEAESEYDAALKKELEAEEKRKGWGGDGGGNDDDAFTMDMMLRKLNVNLDAIGFDAREQKWIS